MIIDDYWCLWMIILLWYISVVCINGGSGSLFFVRIFLKIDIINIKLWMSGINSVRKL